MTPLLLPLLVALGEAYAMSIILFRKSSIEKSFPQTQFYSLCCFVFLILIFFLSLSLLSHQVSEAIAKAVNIMTS